MFRMSRKTRRKIWGWCRMIQIVKTITEGRYNLVNTDFPDTDNKHYIRSLSEKEIRDIIRTGDNVLHAEVEGGKE